MRSRVMPGSSPTIERRCPIIALNKVDLPTFGRPTITTDGSVDTYLYHRLLPPNIQQHRGMLEGFEQNPPEPQPDSEHAQPPLRKVIRIVFDKRIDADPHRRH